MHEPQDHVWLQGLDVFAKRRQFGKRSRSCETEVRGPRVCVTQDANQAFPWMQAMTQGKGLADHRDVDVATGEQSWRIVETKVVGPIDEMGPVLIALDDRGVAGMGERIKAFGKVRTYDWQLRPSASDARQRVDPLAAHLLDDLRVGARIERDTELCRCLPANCPGIFRVWSPEDDACFDHDEA